MDMQLKLLLHWDFLLIGGHNLISPAASSCNLDQYNCTTNVWSEYEHPVPCVGAISQTAGVFAFKWPPLRANNGPAGGLPRARSGPQGGIYENPFSDLFP